MELDGVDEHILSELFRDARQPKKDIGSSVKRSPSTVDYRITQLEDEGIIDGYYAEIDTSRLGYKTVRLLLSLRACSPKRRQDLLNDVKNHPKTIWLFECSGPWDIDIVYTATDTTEIIRQVNTLTTTYNDIINQSNVALLNTITRVTPGYISDQTHTETIHDVANSVHDNKNHQRFLKHFAQQPTAPMWKIAEAADITPKTAAKYHTALRQANVLFGVKPVLNIKALGREYVKTHYWYQDVTQDSLRSIKRFWEEKEPTAYFDAYAGGADLDIELHVTSLNEFDTLQEQARQHHGEHILQNKTLRFTEQHVFKHYAHISSSNS